MLKENNSLQDTIKGNISRIEELHAGLEKENEIFKAKEIALSDKNHELQVSLTEKTERLKESGSNFNVMQSKITELEKVNMIVKKEVDDLKKLQGNDKDLNLIMLRKMFADLKKEKEKLEESRIKDTEELKKQKIILEEDLRTAHVEIKDISDEKNTFMKLFKNMNELLEIKGINIPPVNGENIPNESMFVCEKCDYKTSDKDLLKMHKRNHHENVSIRYPCEHCNQQFKDKTALIEHNECYHSENKCNRCAFKTRTRYALLKCSTQLS